MFALAIVIFWGAWLVVLYTYVLFPLLLHVLARLFGNRQPAEVAQVETAPRVAMVVAAFNEAHVIYDKLRNTWELDYPRDRFELVIGSDGSSDNTANILRACEDSRLRAFPFSERRGKISVLNDLMQRVDADIVVMSDANTMYAPDAIWKLVRRFSDPKVGCVSGELSLEQEGGTSGEGLYWKYEGWIKRNEGRLGFLIGCNGGIFAIRRELYEPLPPSTIVEDFVLSMRVLEKGHRVEFEPAAKATEPPAVNSKAEMIRKIRIGAGGFQALSLTRSLLHPKFGLRSFAFWGHKVLRWCVPLALFAGLLANIALAVEQTSYLAALALQAGGAIIAGLAYRTRSRPALPRWTRPISYFYLMNFALLCGFFRYLRGTQRVTWDRLAPAGGVGMGGSAAAIIEQRPITVHTVVRIDAPPSTDSTAEKQPDVEGIRPEPMSTRG